METRKRKTYRNYTRSERAIVRAYVELMKEKGSGRISVTDIVTVADLNRSTFYAHFKSSEDVREKIHSNIINEFIGSFKHEDYKNLLSNPHFALQRILDFIRGDEKMYKTLLQTEGAVVFLKRLENTVIERYLSDEEVMPLIKDKDEFEMNLRIFIGGFIMVLQDWANDELKVPLERVIDLMETAIRSCTKSYMRK